MMERRLTWILCIGLSILTSPLLGQFWNGQDSIFGNEWVQFDQTYYKIKVSKDGVYRLDQAFLSAQGIPVSTINASDYQLWKYGEKVPVFSSTDGPLSNSDYLLFYGEQNRGEFDVHLYPNREEDQLNPEYSLFNDTVAYFLTWETGGSNPQIDQVNNNIVNAPEEPFFIDDLKVVHNEGHVKYCEDIRCYKIYSIYDKGQGFASTSSLSIYNQIIEPKHYYDLGPAPVLEVRATSNFPNASSEGRMEVYINDELVYTRNRRLQDVPFLHQMSEEINEDLMAPSMEVTVTGGTDQFDRYAVSVLNLKYPRTFNFEGKDFYKLTIGASPIPKKIIIENFNGGPQLGVFDLTNQTYRLVDRDPQGHYELGLPVDTEARDIVLFNLESIQNVNQSETVTFVDYSQMDPSYVILSHPEFTDDGNGGNPVNEYANYRSSAEGGNYDVSTVMITDLYNQFSYGINYHPSSVRHFVQWFKKNWNRADFLFIIGKGVENQLVRNGPNNFFFIPTFGRPGADGLLVSDPYFNPLVATGRIPVITPDEISTYLEKVQLHEGHANAPQTIEDQFWTKRAIHLSGGEIGKTAELALLRGGLDRLGEIIEDNRLGMDVATFQKSTTGVVTVADNQELTGLVNDGISLITYFGHSTINLLDFQIIDDVSLFEPNTHFPIFMGMGCYAGQIHDSQRRSYSEKWTLAKERGSIVFIANSSAGFISSLETMGSQVYTNYGEDYFNQPIGLNVLNTIQTIIKDNRSAPKELNFTIDTELAFSLNICGDPAISLNISDGADYILDPRDLSIEENIITVETDSIHLNWTIANLGEYVEDSILVRFEQTLENGSVELLKEINIPAPIFKDAYQITLPNLKEAAIGFNKINIVVDATNEVNERPDPSAELNNDLRYNDQEFCFFVTSLDARPVCPTDFSIVNDPMTALIASTTDANAPQTNYIFQIDTTEEFNSPFLREETINRVGGLLSWTPGINFENESVYYWRVTPDSVGRGNYSWRNHSFVYVENGNEGWNQSHYYQFLYNTFDSVIINEEKRNWQFEFKPQKVTIKNTQVVDATFLRPAIIRNGVIDWEYYQFNPRRQSSSSAVRSGVYVTLYDPIIGNFLPNPSPGLYGSVNNSGGDMPFFAFNTQEYDGRVALMNFLENNVPEGYYVFFLTIQEENRLYGAPDWANDVDSTINKSIFDVLEGKGATQVRQISLGDVPYSFIYQEGNPDFENTESIGVATAQDEFNVFINALNSKGKALSVEVGPALSWTNFSWKREGLEANDIMACDIIGIKADGSETILVDSFTLDLRDLSDISALEYPHLRLSFYAEDTINRSMAQLDQWRITYEGLMELAVDLNNDFFFQSDTLQQGEILKAQFAFENVGKHPSDSVLIRYNIIDVQNQVISSFQKSAPTVSGDRIISNFDRNTSDLSGDYRLIIDINPDGDQKELYPWNNTIIIPFTVVGDERNPLLDVTFDGLHILDGDLVSAQPEILIRLTDENQFLLLNDTSLFNLQIKYPNESSFRELSLSDMDVDFIPATTGQNEASIMITRRFPVDGIYTLKVNASDRSGNSSGDVDFQTRFEIVNESSISEILNYPNPFSTSTQFVYTLTGESAPSFFKIQIITVSGKVVREITSAEMGDLRVGKHMTAYRYDGTDQYGDPLANGVYLYRVVTKDANGDDMKKRDVGISNYFKNGWGKMVILR